MLAKFSVKKPLTILVAVILVIVFGVVAFIKMTPDLLPNMDFPYVVVVTVYPGASPERVETTITKPVEQASATLDDIKTINSTSSENYSLVILEFSNGVNMDAATMNLREKLDALASAWPETVGSSTIMKINPDMLPVNVSAVSLEGYDTIALSEFVNKTLMPKLEGIEGVASVSASGTVTETINVTISQEKLQKLNGRIRKAIDVNFEEPMKEITDARQEIEDNEELLDDGQREIDSGRSQLYSGKISAQKQFEDAQAQIDSGRQQLDSALELAGQLQSLLAIIQDDQRQLDEAIAERASIPDEGRTEEQEQRASKLDARIPILTQTIETLKGSLPSEADIQAAMTLLNTADAQYQALSEAQKQLDDAKAQANIEMQNAEAQLSSGQYQIESARQQIKDAQAQLDEAEKVIEEKRQEAYDSVDATDIVTMDTVSQLIGAQSFAMPAGYVSENGESWLVYVGDSIKDVDELRDLVIFDFGMDKLEPITVSDVADVEVIDDSDSIFAMINGSNGVFLTFNKQSNCATATVSDAIIKEFEALSEEYEGLSFVPLMDQGDYIHLVIDSVLDNLIIGAVLAIIILLFFLRDIRPTFIVACSIPISVTFAIVLMYFSGVTLNIISMSGLAVAVGMLVDNSIVVIENIYRLRQRGESVFRSAISGAAQVAGAITASTLTTVLVFAPIVFVEGLTRQIFQDMALTIGYSLMASLIIALTLIPAMAGGMLKRTRETKPTVFGKLMNVYSRLLDKALGHKLIVILLCIVLLVGSAYGVLSRGFVYIPEMDSTQMTLTIKLDEDATVEDARAVTSEIYARIAEMPYVQTVGMMQSSGIAGVMGFGSSGSASFETLSGYIVLSEDKKETSQVIAREIEEKCADLDCELSVASSGMDMSMLSGSGISLKIYGEDLDKLRITANEIADIIKGVEGIKTVNDGRENTAPELLVSVDKAAAVKYGLTTAQVYMEVMAATTNTATAATIGENDREVIVIDSPDGKTVDDIRGLEFTVKGFDGTEKTVKLSDVADISETETMQSIRRAGQRRYVSVTAEIDNGYNVTLVSSDVQDALDEYDIPSGMRIELDGENEQIMDAMEDLLLLLALGIVIVYLIMVAQFQSLLSPFIVMFTIPLAFTGGLIALLIGGFEISIVSMIGFVILVGIIVNNGIVLIDCMNQLRAEGVERREAITEACKMRMRPVLMTALTTILGLIPMAAGAGLGAAIIQPVAVVAIGGLIYATLMTLFVVPVIYDSWCKKPPRTVTAADLEIIED